MSQFVGKSEENYGAKEEVEARGASTTTKEGLFIHLRHFLSFLLLQSTNDGNEEMTRGRRECR